jgi:hypothetical protein
VAVDPVAASDACLLQVLDRGRRGRGAGIRDLPLILASPIDAVRGPRRSDPLLFPPPDDSPVVVVTTATAVATVHATLPSPNSEVLRTARRTSEHSDRTPRVRAENQASRTPLLTVDYCNLIEGI